MTPADSGLARFGKPVWHLVKALATSPSLPGPVRAVAILVTGASYLIGLYCMVSVTLNSFDIPVPE